MDSVRTNELILAIESSCDETSAAVVRGGREIMSNVVSSQISTHMRFGGVVPEIASRKHVEAITLILEGAMAEAEVPLAALDAIAVTQGPGLIGALFVGNMAAKTLAMALNIPLIGTNHIAGHIYANQLVGTMIYPSVALVVSGGHTELVYMEREGSFEILGETRDDAVGEAYDKVARALGIPYPGGPHIDRLASRTTEEIVMPRAWLEHGSLDFSFSGLKSAVLNTLNHAQMKGETLDPAALARGFQHSVVDVVVTKALEAVRRTHARQLVLGGGVAANSGLRAELTARCQEEGIPLLIPPLSLTGDNAAMIGAAAHLKWMKQSFNPLDMQADPNLSLPAWGV
jgi:N6-L-threonylcarbamoyladenine synthase